MTEIDPVSWFLVALTFSVLAITGYIIRNYAKQYRDLKYKIHAIHAMIELIDKSLEDDTVTKDEFTAIVKRCLEILKELI